MSACGSLSQQPSRPFGGLPPGTLGPRESTLPIVREYGMETVFNRKLGESCGTHQGAKEHEFTTPCTCILGRHPNALQCHC